MAFVIFAICFGTFLAVVLYFLEIKPMFKYIVTDVFVKNGKKISFEKHLRYNTLNQCYEYYYNVQFFCLKSKWIKYHLLKDYEIQDYLQKSKWIKYHLLKDYEIQDSAQNIDIQRYDGLLFVNKDLVKRYIDLKKIIDDKHEKCDVFKITEYQEGE